MPENTVLDNNVSSIIKKENCIPSIRFPEFDTKWTFIKLSDVTTSFDYGLAYPSKKFDGENKYIRITDIDEETNSYCKDDIVSPDGKLTKEYLVNADDILFARTGASTGKTYLYNHKDGTLYFAGFLIRAHIKDEINSKFVFLNTQTLRYKKWIAITSMRSGQPGINSQEYANFKFYLPDKKEQDKISDFITLIDNLIAKQIKYISTFETYNRGLISKIFKQEIRFKDDNGNQFPDWKEKQICDVCEYVDYRGKTPKKQDYGIQLITAKNIRNGYIDYDISKEYIAKEDYKDVMHRGLPKLGDVLITTEAPCGYVAQIDSTNIALAQRVIKYRGYKNIIDNTFLKYVFLSDNFQVVLSQKASGGTVKGIKGSILHKLKIPVPYFREQLKIANCLSAVDRVLEQEKVYLDQLKAIKKGLLQQMFV